MRGATLASPDPRARRRLQGPRTAPREEGEGARRRRPGRAGRVGGAVVVRGAAGPPRPDVGAKGGPKEAAPPPPGGREAPAAAPAVGPAVGPAPVGPARPPLVPREAPPGPRPSAGPRRRALGALPEAFPPVALGARLPVLQG